MSLEDYDVLNILNQQSPFKTYKVKQKYTNDIFVWHILDYEDFKKADLEDLEEQLKLRIGLHHPHILEFHNYFKQEEVNSLYIVSKFCENGSLQNLMKMCINDHKHLTEEFLCRIVYQIAFAIKTIEQYVGEFQLTEIFVDDDFNVKLYNFDVLNNGGHKQHKMISLGALLYKLCSLSYDGDIKIGISYKELQNLKFTYSKEMLSFISSLLQDDGELKKNVDKILCNSMILLKSQQWNKTQCFVDDETPISCHKSSACSGNCLEEKNHFRMKLEKLRNREAALLIREQNIDEREYRLANKERKIALMEKKVQEKLQKAELYLKHSRNTKVTTSRCSSSETSEKYQQTNEKLDSTYVSCVDSVVHPTSKKLNVNAIVKPAPFTRTLSERRIRFKGYSPLKDIDSNKRRSIRLPKTNKNRDSENASKSDWVTCSEDNVSEVLKNRSSKKCKQLFPKTVTAYENACDIKLDNQSKPPKWTEENKKYAFKLLRLMNSDKENITVEVKHTYL